MKLEELAELSLEGLAAVLAAVAGALLAQSIGPHVPQRATHDDDDELVSAAAAATLLACSKDHVYRARELAGCRLKLGRRVAFSRNGLQAFIRRRTR